MLVSLHKELFDSEHSAHDVGKAQKLPGLVPDAVAPVGGGVAAGGAAVVEVLFHLRATVSSGSEAKTLSTGSISASSAAGPASFAACISSSVWASASV